MVKKKDPRVACLQAAFCIFVSVAECYLRSKYSWIPRGALTDYRGEKVTGDKA